MKRSNQQPALPLSRRPVVLGILNLLFAAIYLVLCINAANHLAAVDQRPSSLRDSFLTAGNLEIVADLLASAWLLVGGILLLKHRQAGRKLTRLVAIICVLMIVYTGYFLVTVGSGLPAGDLIGAIVATLRFAYPILATRLFDTSRLELGLA